MRTSLYLGLGTGTSLRIGVPPNSSRTKAFIVFGKLTIYTIYLFSDLVSFCFLKIFFGLKLSLKNLLIKEILFVLLFILPHNSHETQLNYTHNLTIWGNKGELVRGKTPHISKLLSHFTKIETHHINQRDRIYWISLLKRRHKKQLFSILFDFQVNFN